MSVDVSHKSERMEHTSQKLFVMNSKSSIEAIQVENISVMFVNGRQYYLRISNAAPSHKYRRFISTLCTPLNTIIPLRCRKYLRI